MTMNTENRDDDIARILDAREGRSALEAADATTSERSDLRDLASAADLAWASAQTPPPLADDPVAAMLGLVPDPDLELDSKAFASARKRAGFTISTFAARLTTRGWDVSSKDVFAWESGKNLPHIPALITALAEETGVDPDRLRRQSGVDPERARFAAVVASTTFQHLAARWARLQGTTVALASSALESRMLVAVHRGGAPDAEVLLDSLEAMVSAVEDVQGS